MLPAHMQAILSGKMSAVNTVTTPAKENATEARETAPMNENKKLQAHEIELPELEMHDASGDNIIWED